jgi:predicted extracellular nuclease
MRLTTITLLGLAQSVAATTVADINGNRYLSGLRDQNVTDVEGLVTAKSASGVYVRSTKPDRDAATSESIYVFSKTIGNGTKVGDIIRLGGRVEEYRNNKDYIFLTELTNPVNVTVASSGNKVEAVTIGESGKLIGRGRLLPPTERYSSLDDGDIFGVPNNETQIATANPKLNPSKYGLDFWESLSGELVTVNAPRVLGAPNQYGDTWVIGDWPATGINERGGITVRNKDANPEAIVIGSPLDGTKNSPDTKLGDKLDTITGVVSQAFGYYRILPLTALKVLSSEPSTAPVTTITSRGVCSGLTVGSANVENLSPNSSTIPTIAETIAKYMKSPDVVFMQEIQDNSGPTNNGEVSANQTLGALADEVAKQGGVDYEFADVSPVDNEDGGQPGGNIRTAFFYNPKVLRLVDPNPALPTEDNDVLPGPKLKYNPGRILGSTESIFDDSRKPLVAEFETVQGGHRLFAVNVHFQSKGGGTTLHGDGRRPVNGGVEDRTEQARTTAEFVKKILAQDKNAAVVAAGDMNEFAFVEPLEVFASVSGLKDADEAFKVSELERYTYFFQGVSCLEIV